MITPRENRSDRGVPGSPRKYSGALYWAVRHGEFKKLEKTSRQIFDEEEPEGVHTDFFPGEADKMRRKLARSRKPEKPGHHTQD